MGDGTSSGPPSPGSADIPTAAEVRGDLAATPVVLPGLRRDFDAGFSQAVQEADRASAHLQGLKEHYSHKSRWSYFLMAVMAAMIWYQSYLLYKVGSGAWNFTAYEWLLPALLVQNLAQIAGLCVIVVKALFKDVK